MKKNILVTGADGFIGSHLVEMLVAHGAKVKALSLYNSFNYWGWLEDIKYLNDIEVIAGDIRDPHFCMKITKNIDIIFHLAALIAIPYSYIAPDSYIDTNIKGTLNILQAALRNNCERVIHTSTSEVYGTAKYVPIDESHPLQPQSPYSATKIGADALASSFYNAFNLPVIIARPFNTYGPRQSARAVIPTLITQIASGKRSVKAGNSSPTRDFNFVMDICNGFLLLSQTEKINGEVINIGSNSEISIKNVFTLICRLMNREATIAEEKQRIRPEKSEVYRLICDNSKIHALTGYLPKYSLEEGLKITIDWYRNKKNLEKYKTEIYNV
jgi:NAD dependent epimerase/dehydratase